MSIGSLGAIGQQGQQNPTGYDAFQDVDLDAFIRLLVVELANQDPLDPVDNSEILQQVSQVREIASNEKLSDTLDAVKLGQNVATAAGLIGRKIVALNDDSQQVIGTVERVSIEYGVPKLIVDGQAIDIRNVAGILASTDEEAADANLENTVLQDNNTQTDNA